MYKTSKKPPVKEDFIPFAITLKQLRQKSGKSPYAVAKSFPWENQTPLDLIEDARRLPAPTTITRLVECLGGTFADECLLLGLANYLPRPRVPTFDQIKRELTPIAEEMRTCPYPIYILDRGFTFWVANPAAMMFIPNLDRIDDLGRNTTTAFDLAFELAFGDRVSDHEYRVFARRASETVQRSQYLRSAYELLPELPSVYAHPTSFRRFQRL